MGKEEKGKEIQEKEGHKEETKPEKKITKDEINEKIDAAEKKVEKVTGERVNIIGDIEKPDRSEPGDVARFFRELSEKVDELLTYHRPKKEEIKKEPEIKPEPPKKIPWYERKIL